MRRTPLKRRRKAPPPPGLRDRQAAFGALALARDAECAGCGHKRADGPRLEVHHCVPKDALRRLGIDEWDQDWGVVLCAEPAPNRCHGRHTLAVARVPYERLRPENVEIAERHGLGWLLEKNHPRETACT